MNNVCDVCGTTPVSAQPPLDGLQSHGRDCPRCGKFWLVGTAAEALRQLIRDGAINKSILSHRLRRRFDASQKPVVLYETDLQIYVGDTALPKPQEQTDNLILWIGDWQKTPDDWAQGTSQRIAAIVGAAKTTDRSDEPGFNWLYSQITGSGLFDKTDSNNGSEIRLRLKMTGWKLYDELRKRVLESHTAFMAMKFGDPTMDKVLIQCFKPAVKLAGFELRALNEKQAPDLLTIRFARQSGPPGLSWPTLRTTTTVRISKLGSRRASGCRLYTPAKPRNLWHRKRISIPTIW